MNQADNPLSRLPKKQGNPADRMRSILSAAQENKVSPDTPTVRPDPQPALVPKQESSRRKDASRRRSPREKPSRPLLQRDKLLPAFWTVAGALSLTINVILIAIVLSLMNNLSKVTIQLPPVNKLPGDLYRNFELMDRAHIQTVIPVQGQVPVSFDLQLDSQTVVTLSKDVTVRGAYVVINTPLIDINAPANVTLPAGSALPIRLQMTVPVQTVIPISLDVPVDIDLGKTGLHQPFQGLRQAVKPYYCMFEPDALSVDGAPVCR